MAIERSLLEYNIFMLSCCTLHLLAWITTYSIILCTMNRFETHLNQIR